MSYQLRSVEKAKGLVIALSKGIMHMASRHMGWHDIHWLARDLGGAGGSHCFSLDRNLSWLLVGGAAPTGALL